MTNPQQSSSGARALVAWTLRHGRLLWAVALLLAIPATWRTATLYLHLRTNIEELLPPKAPSVLAIGELRARMPGLQHLGVIVDVGDAANLPAGEKLVDDLAARIRAYPPELVRRVRLGTTEERQFLERNAPLYLELDDIKTIRARIEARRDYEVQKQLGTLLDEGEAPPAVDFSDIEAKVRSRFGGAKGFPEGRFSSSELRLTMLLVEVGEFTKGKGSPAELLHRVKADLQALGGAERYAPGMRVGYTGDVAISVEETSALMEDLSLSSVLVIIATMAVIIGYYRWWRSVLILIPPLLLATVYSFAVASLPPFGVTALNSNTAFLGSIIIGNGINFGIILLARYVEHRRGGAAVDESLVTAVWATRPGTLAAALAAGTSYASLGITDFRGFRQFGYIGGLGMAFSWGLAFLLIPPLTAWIDKGTRTAPSIRPHGAWMAPISRLIVARPGLIALVAALLTLAAGVKVRSFSAAEIEYDLSRLRRADTWVSGEGYWGRKMDALLGSYLTPLAILTDDVDEARAVAKQLREASQRAPLDQLVASIRTIDDVLPADQAAKIEEVNAIREMATPRLRALIPEDKREAANKLLGADALVPFTAADLPATFAAGMRERDGSFGRTVLVFPRPSRALWVGPQIVALSSSLREVATTALPGKRPGRVAGALTLSGDIFESLRRDGPIVTGTAFLGVAAVVLVLFRRSTTSLVVLGALIVGLLWLLALAMTLGVRLNFTNFIAYPITFGIGVDYAVNVMSRYVKDGGRDVAAAVRSTGGAVGLCSLTTIIGYSSLLIAQNRALYLFGLLAVLGEVTCLIAAVLALPALLQWNQRRRAPLSPEA